MNKLNHLAIIMDGNGRWAKKRGLIRTNGHNEGAKKVDEIAQFCINEKIKNLTLYAFSTENWKRPKTEVDFLMQLLKNFLLSQKEKFIKNGIKFHTIGDISKLNNDLQAEILNLKNLTKNNENLNLTLALNYGGRDEIVRACKKISDLGLEFSEENISKFIDSSEFLDVDLLIRTGGEYRISNFLLWSSSYAELAFTDTFWPEFSVEELKEIVEKFKNKNRRFGGL